MCYPSPQSLGYPPQCYDHEHGEVSAAHRSADRDPDLEIGSWNVSLLATGEQTRGNFGLYRWDGAPNAPGAAAHFHRTLSESFFILDGTLNVYNGESWRDAHAGDFLYVPEGGIHAFNNDRDAPVSMLLLFAPGAPREAYFEASAELARGREFTADQWREICLSHDNHFVEIPPEHGSPTARMGERHSRLRGDGKLGDRRSTGSKHSTRHR